MEEIIEKLKNTGLTTSESKVYLFLLQYKEAKAGIISKKANILSSHIYNILEKLLEKGIISFKIVNNIKVYRPVNPENLFFIIREKEKQIEKEKKELREFISTLKTIEVKPNKENDFKYFEGINGIRSMFSEFTDILKTNSTVHIASAPIAYEKWNAFLLEYFQGPRMKKNVHQQLIVPISMKKYGKEREKLKLLEIKYTKIEQETEFGVSGDYLYFLSQGEKPYALLIKDKNFANTQKKIFDVLWNNSTK
jgi:sugar-specific transcriptional regulator TrmB